MIFAAPKLVRNAIAGNPDLALPHFNLDRVYYEREDFAPAIPAYEKAVERDPSLAAGHFALARAYKPNRQRGRYALSCNMIPAMRIRERLQQFEDILSKRKVRFLRFLR